MKRKLVKQGASTMMISLPTKWIKENKLDKGDEIDLEERNNNLIIGTSMKEKKEIIIEINEENKKDIENLLTHIYRRGFDKIIFNGSYKDSLKNIRSVVSDLLLGFEITQSSQNSITIENLSEPTGQKFDLMLKKSFQIVEETQNIVNNDFEQNKLINLEEIIDLKKQHDRFLLFCRRLLSREKNDKSLLSSWEILNFLMHIEHRYYYLYKYASEGKLEKSKNILELLNGLKEYFKLYSSAYFDSNANAIHKINNMKKEYYFGKCIEYLEKSKGRQSVLLSYIRELYRIIQLGTSPILNEILEKNF